MKKQTPTIKLSDATKQELDRLGISGHTYENKIKNLINYYCASEFNNSKAEDIKQYHKEMAKKLIEENNK